MTYFIIFFLQFFQVYQITNQQHPLSSYQWKNRILIITGDSDEMKNCYQRYKKEEKSIIDRDMVLIYISPSSILTFPTTTGIEDKKLQIIHHFDIQSEKGETILIGKDGGVKLRKPLPVTTDEVFDLIDSMPMRRAEMRDKGN